MPLRLALAATPVVAVLAMMLGCVGPGPRPDRVVAEAAAIAGRPIAGERRTVTHAAGTVTYTWHPPALVEVAATGGWRVAHRHVQPDELDVVFLKAGRRLDVEVEDENSRHIVQICRHVKSDSQTFDVADAGTVVIVSGDGTLGVGGIRPSRGWDAEQIERQIDEITVAFTSRATGDYYEFEAEIESSAIEYEVCAEADSKP